MSVTLSDLLDFNDTQEEFDAARRLRSELRTYVGNVYRYQRQYIYDVVLYQYRQDQLPADRTQQQHVGTVLVEILGDAQQVPSNDDVR